MEKFTPVEQFQATRESREVQGADKPLAPVIEMLKGKPELQEAIALNPYAAREEWKEVRELTDGEFSDQSLAKAAILAEPAREYEEFFQSLDKSEKKEELYNQIDLSADMVVRMVKKAEELGDKIFGMPPAELYKVFAETAFESNDPAEINQKFAQNQRRGFRLAIENFIEDQQNLAKDQQYAREHPKYFLEKMLGEQFMYDVSAEFSPFGIVFYLEQEDYAVASQAQDVRHIVSLGSTLYRDAIPAKLRGRIMIINKQEQDGNPKKPEEIAATKKHELHHAAFNNIFSTRELILYLDYANNAPKIKNIDGQIANANMAIPDLLELSKDELIAYSANGQLETTSNAIAGNRYELVLEEVMKQVNSSSKNSKEKATIIEIYSEANKRFSRLMRRNRWIAEALMEAAQKEHSEISPDKAIALLQVTPAEKWSRLQPYFDKPERPIDSLYNEYISSKVEKLEQDIQDYGREDIGPEEQLKVLHTLVSKDRNFIEIFRPPEALSVILKPMYGGLYHSSIVEMIGLLIDDGDPAVLAQSEEIDNILENLIYGYQIAFRDETIDKEICLNLIHTAESIRASLNLKKPEAEKDKKSFFENLKIFIGNLVQPTKQPAHAMSFENKLEVEKALDSVETMISEGNLTTAELNVAEEAAEAATTLGNKEITHEANEILDDIKVLEQQEKIKNL